MLCWLCKPTEIEPERELSLKKMPQQQQRSRAPLAGRTQISIRNAGTYSSASIDTAIGGYI